MKYSTAITVTPVGLFMRNILPPSGVVYHRFVSATLNQIVDEARARVERLKREVPVSTLVNSPRNEDAKCILPI